MFIEVYRVEGCALYANPQLPAIALEGKGYVGTEVYREMCERALALLGEQPARKMLVDMRDMVNISFADQQWAICNWVPRLIQAGLRTVAIISSRYYFHRVAVETIVNAIAGEQLEVRYFDDRAAAETWLQSA